jgi:ferredoxin
MPTVKYMGHEIECAHGERLRDVLRAADMPVHNGQAAWFNCKGFGTCGTCAVRIDEQVGPKNARETWRLDFPPHVESSGLRLACQIRVEHDLTVTKYPGFWGQHVEQAPCTPDTSHEE